MLENAPEIVAALRAVAVFMNEVGLPGLIALILSGPLVTAGAFFALDFYRQRSLRQEHEARRQEERVADEARRQDAQAERALLLGLMENSRDRTNTLVEGHRMETAAILRDFSAKHAEVAQYYRDNVELVKVTQRLAVDLRDIILNNTRAVERLTSAVEANFFCPMAREAATGKK